MSIDFKGRHFLKDIILIAVRWYVAYSLSYRDIEELMAEHNINVDNATINRWVIKYSPELLDVFKSKKKSVDKFGNTIDFLLSKNRTKKAARKFFNKAIKSSDMPAKGFKSFTAAAATLSGIELHHTLRKGQHKNSSYLNIFEQFYSLAA